MLVLGLNPAENASASLVLDGVLVFAAEEERFVGKKHVQCVPVHAIAAGLRHLGARLRDVDRVAIGWSPLAGIPRRILASLRMLDAGSWSATVGRGTGYATLVTDALFIRRRLQAAWPDEPLRFGVGYWPHHLAHAAAAHYWSGEEESAVLTADGVGEQETTVLWHARDGRFEPIEHFRFPDSLGHFYSVMTGYLGLGMGNGEGKTMGLASYGEPAFQDSLWHWTSDEGGRLRLDVRRINYPAARAGRFHADLIRVLGPPVTRATDRDERHCAVAASAQAVLERHVEALARRLADRVRVRALCLAGGVALNCSCNGRLFDLGLFERIHVCPAPTDAGTAVGAALLEAARGGARPSIPEPVFLGPRDDETLPDRVPGLWSGATPVASVADLLAEGLVVAVFHDRMEFGPRALGNRSILVAASPRAMKDRVNDHVKFREPFRPFAPAILAEAAAEYFELPGNSPFMAFAFRARTRARDRMPATVHVDGTGRLQTVDRARFPLFHEILRAYRERTGCAGVLNTSLNVKGRPIVAAKRDALKLLQDTGLDALWADGRLFVKEHVGRRPAGAASPAFRGVPWPASASRRKF